MKVVINSCFGGFGLSNEAFERLLELKGIEWEYGSDSVFGGANYYEKGHVGDDAYYLWDIGLTKDRTDPNLITVVEEFGDKANSRFSELKIVEIPDDVEWDIVEYDGTEWVAEKHRTWR